jgi:DNA-binding beta-propeller fold protein YncE
MQKLLFSTDTDSGTVTVYDIANDQRPIAKIQVGNGPRGAVRFTKDGRGFVTNHAGNTLSEIDAFALNEVTKIKVGIAPIGLAIVPGDRYAVVSNSGDNSVSIVDLNARQEVFMLPVGREPRHPDVTPSGAFALVPLSGGDSIIKIDLTPLGDSTPDFSRLRVVGRAFLGAGSMPYSAAVSPRGDSVVAANNQVDFISIVDLSSMNVRKTVPVGTKGARGTAFVPDGTAAFVSLEDSSEIVVVDMAAGVVTQRIPSGPGPRGLYYDSSTATIFGSCFTRTKSAIGAPPNSVSIMSVGATPLTMGAAPALKSVSVGAGPCSVSVFER